MADDKFLYANRRIALERIFKLVDKDRSGIIGLSELRAMFPSSSPQANLELATNALKWFDQNSDQGISMDEYCQQMEMSTMMMGDDEFDDLVQRLLRTAAGSSAAQQHGDSAGSGAGGGDSGGGYHHPEANRLYLQSSVLPLLREGLVALTAHVEQQRIRLASGVEWEEDGPYQPRGWRPFQPVRWLADWLDAHRPAGGGRDVPWEEMSREAKLGAVFDHLDADGSGALDLQELMLLVSRTPGQDVERAAGLMSQMDADQSGNVDMREYVAIMDALTAGLPDDQFDAMIKKMLSSRSYVSLSGREEKLAFIMQEAASAPGSRLDGASLTLGQLLAAARAFAPQLSDRDLLAAMGRADTSEPGPSLDELVPADEVLLFLQSSFASHVDSESEFDTLVMKAVDAVLSLSSQQAGVEPDAADCIQPDRFREQVKGMATHGAAPQMSVPDFVALQGQQPEAVLVVLDVRTAEEAAVSMIPGARRCPVVRDDGAPYGWRLAADSGVADLQAHVERMRFAAERAMEEAAVAAQVAAVDDGNDAAATAPLPALPALSIHVVAYCNTGERGGAAAVELSKLLGVPVHNLCGGAITYYNKGGFMVAAAPAAEPAAEAEAPPGSEGTAAAAPNAAVAQQQQQYQQAAAPQPVNALHPGVLKCLGLIKRRNAFDVKLLKRPGSSALY